MGFPRSAWGRGSVAPCTGTVVYHRSPAEAARTRGRRRRGGHACPQGPVLAPGREKGPSVGSSPKEGSARGAGDRGRLWSPLEPWVACRAGVTKVEELGASKHGHLPRHGFGQILNLPGGRVVRSQSQAEASGLALGPTGFYSTAGPHVEGAGRAQAPGPPRAPATSCHLLPPPAVLSSLSEASSSQVEAPSPAVLNPQPHPDHRVRTRARQLPEFST